MVPLHLQLKGDKPHPLKEICKKFNLLTPTSDQDIIFPYNINTKS